MKQYTVKKTSSQRLGYGIFDNEVGLFVDDFTDQAGTEHATFGEPKHLMALAASLNANPDMRASRTKFQRRFYGDAPMLGMVNNGVPK